MTERRLYKRCSCRSSASGPRLLISDGQPYGQSDPDCVSVLVRYLEFACDACDEEWTESKP